MCTFENIAQANESIKTMEISRTDKKTGKTITKDYAEVNQRIKAFRMVFPNGTIRTDIVKLDDEVCVFRAEVFDGENLLGTGTAFELKTSSFINQTSYIENCETSAVGRALGMCGFGIDTSVASYEEVATAINNQSKPKEEAPKETAPESAIKSLGITKADLIECAKKHYPTGSEAEGKLLQCWNIKKIEDASIAQLQVIWNKYHG